MNMSANTILITGGTSGIGLELATQFLSLGNTVIVTGRDPGKLERVQAKLEGIHAFQSDACDPKAIQTLFHAVTERFPTLNVLINNAGIMRKIDLLGWREDTGDIEREIETNLAAPVRMTEQFLPHLRLQETAAIVNVSSGLAFVPFPAFPIYCAAKAGLHSFTQSLRVQLRGTKVKVFELAPPMTRTPLLAADFHLADIPAMHAMDVRAMVRQAMDGLRRDRLEIRPGRSNLLKLMSRIAPQFVLNRLSKPAEKVLAGSASP